MPAKPPTKAEPAPEVQDEPGAEQRFAKGIANALRMPPKPHDGASASKAKTKRKA